MTRADQFGHVCHLLAPVQLQREVAGSPSEREQIYGGHDHLALRNDYAVLFSAVDKTGDSVSEIAANNCIDIETWQAGNVRDERFGVEQIHMRSPLQGELHSNTCDGDPKVTAENKFHDRCLYRAAPCAKTIQALCIQPVDLRRVAA